VINKPSRPSKSSRCVPVDCASKSWAGRIRDAQLCDVPKGAVGHNIAVVPCFCIHAHTGGVCFFSPLGMRVRTCGNCGAGAVCMYTLRRQSHDAGWGCLWVNMEGADKRRPHHPRSSTKSSLTAAPFWFRRHVTDASEH
jgi:hypothetical protein